jgi:hypothetical protein
MDETFLRLRALADQQPLADTADYLNCKSFDTIEIDTDGPEFDFLRELPFGLQNCLLMRVAVAVLRQVAEFLDAARHRGQANVYAMVSVRDFFQFPPEGPRNVDGTNGRLGIGIWCGNFANPLLRSFALEGRPIETAEGRFVLSCLGAEEPGLEIHEVFDESMASHVLDSIFIRLSGAVPPWAEPYQD